MNTWKRRFVLAIIGLAFLISEGCAQKYAVLISTNQVTADDVAYHSEWWYDLFHHYKMLKENGFADDHINVLYGNGTDFNTIHPAYNASSQFGKSITNMAVSKANIQSIFNNLKGKVRTRDYLYVWWMGHGGGSGPGSCNLSMSISNTGETVTDTEFVGYINNVANYKKRSVAVMTCHSGGVVDNLNTPGKRTLVLTSSTCAQSSYDAPSTCNGLFQAEFNYTLPNAYRQKNPCGGVVGSDYDKNGFVSWSEAHQYNASAMTSSTPQLGDPDNIAANTYIKKNDP